MTDHLIKTGMPLVVSDLDPLSPDDWKPTQPLIAGAGTAQIFEERPDGTKTILVRGLSRVRLITVLQEKPFIRCQVEPLSDQSAPIEGNLFFLQRLRQSLKAWAKETLPDSDAQTAFHESIQTPARALELYAHYRVTDADLRQKLLELDDINQRIELLRLALGSARQA